MTTGPTYIWKDTSQNWVRRRWLRFVSPDKLIIQTTARRQQSTLIGIYLSFLDLIERVRSSHFEWLLAEFIQRLTNSHTIILKSWQNRYCNQLKNSRNEVLAFRNTHLFWVSRLAIGSFALGRAFALNEAGLHGGASGMAALSLVWIGEIFIILS